MIRRQSRGEALEAVFGRIAGDDGMERDGVGIIDPQDRVAGVHLCRARRQNVRPGWCAPAGPIFASGRAPTPGVDTSPRANPTSAGALPV